MLQLQRGNLIREGCLGVRHRLGLRLRGTCLRTRASESLFGHRLLRGELCALGRRLGKRLSIACLPPLKGAVRNLQARVFVARLLERKLDGRAASLGGIAALVLAALPLSCWRHCRSISWA